MDIQKQACFRHFCDGFIVHGHNLTAWVVLEFFEYHPTLLINYLLFYFYLFVYFDQLLHEKLSTTVTSVQVDPKECFPLRCLLQLISKIKINK